MKPSVAVLLGATLALFAAGTLLGLSRPTLAQDEEPEGAPTITLLSPDPVIAGDYTMQVRVENFDLLAAGEANDGSGQIFYALNKQGTIWLPCSGYCAGGQDFRTTNTTFTFHDLKVGDRIAAVLVRTDGTQLSPSVELSRTAVNTLTPRGGPRLSFDGTLPNPLVPNAGDFTARVIVGNVSLVPPGSGEPNDRSHGHLRYTLNGQPCIEACANGQEPETIETTFTFHDLFPGDQVGVELLNNDGRQWDPPIAARLTVATPVLQLKSLQPVAGSTDFEVRVVSFTLVKPTSPARENNAGAGHIHYLIQREGENGFSHAPGLYATANTRFHFDDLEAGDIIAAELVNHDHSSLTPPVRVTYTVLPKDEDFAAPGPGPLLAVGLLLAAAVAGRKLRA